jgi:arginyl-tRNA synthetase
MENIKRKLAEILKVHEEEISFNIPPINGTGDFSYSVFKISLERKISPVLLAEQIVQGLKELSEIEDASSINGYINFRTSDILLRDILKNVNKGLTPNNHGQNKQVMIEYFSPNTNKPLHVGHLRNLFIGDALSNLLEFSGYKVIRANLYNDRGIHICKAMVAYQKWGNNLLPEETGKKEDHFVGDFYVMFNKKRDIFPEIEGEAQQLLQEWENNKQDVIAKWKVLRDWVVRGFNKTLERFAIKPFNINYWESEYWREGVDVIKKGLKNQVFKEGINGSIIADLEENGIKPLLRSDGTALYLTQDIYLAEKKFREYPELDKSVYIVASEQTEHFKALFEILRLMGHKWYSKCYHLEYGMIMLKGGKLKSREGITADADTLLDDLETVSYHELLKRNSVLEEEELRFRASKIAVSAIKWEILKVNQGTNISFNPKSAFNPKGNTGPYILYTYARISSVVRKVVGKQKDTSMTDLLPSEREIIAMLYFFPERMTESVKNYNFSGLCNYLYQLANLFNTYFQNTRIIKHDQYLEFRLNLATAVGATLKQGLSILGIDTLDEM